MTTWSPTDAPTTSYTQEAGMLPSDVTTVNISEITEDAEAARDAAQTAQTAAEAAQTAAEAAQTAAETAETNAETAETNAETAETNAQTHANTASTASTAAQNAQTAAETAKTAAETAQTNAETAETNAETAETNAQASADEAENWAQKIDGEAVTGEGYSSKAWATGGTGVTDTAGSGAAKEWAVEQSGTVDGTEYSAKEYAIGTQTAQSNGSAKQWAIGGGVSFDRDTIVSGSEYSAKYWANQAANSVSTFDEKYYGTYSSDAAAETAHTNGGFTVAAGDLYFNDTDNKLKYYDGTSWTNIEGVDTSAFATAGFSIAMSIAL